MRSLEPMEMNWQSLSSAGSCHSREGTSSMVPMRRRLGAGRTRAASAYSRPRAARNSATVATMGNMTDSGRPPAASSSARTWRRSSAGRSSATRRERQPMAGFSSSCAGASGSILSPPRSRVRNSTGRSPAASSTRAYSAVCSAVSASAPRASMAISVRNRPMPSAPTASSWSSSSARPTFSIRLKAVPSAVTLGCARRAP